jgi:hypothetical protein
LANLQLAPPLIASRRERYFPPAKSIICVSVILSLLISTLLIVVVALLITVNPDLVEELKRLVILVLRAWLKMPSIASGNLIDRQH